MLMNFYFILQKQSFSLCLFYQQIKWKKKTTQWIYPTEKEGDV